MTALKEQIRQGSFRGAPFLYVDSSADIGRRVALHEYPLRDKPYAEDLGRKARRFQLDVFVLGAQWKDARDALIAALEAPGAGKLVHPNFGEMQASVTAARIVESWDKVGRADFALEFVESGDITFSATIVPQPVAEVAAAASDAQAAAEADFGDTFDAGGAPSWVAGAAIGDVSSAFSAVAAAAAVVGAANAALNTVTSAVQSVESTIASIVAVPETLAGDIVGIVQSASQLVGFGVTTWNELVDTLTDVPSEILASIMGAQLDIAGLIGISSAPPPPLVAANDPDRVRQAANTQAIFALVRRAALCEAAQAAVATPWQSSDAAATARDQISDALDAEILAATDDGVKTTLNALADATVRALDTIAAKLPPLLIYVPTAPLAAVVVAHDLYDDPSWAEDIVQRNDVRNPVALIPGLPLEVLGT